MSKTIIICVAIICATVVICFTVVWVSKYAQSGGYVDSKNVRKILIDLQEQIDNLRSNIVSYNDLRGSIYAMQKRIKELEDKIKESNGEPNF